MLTAVLAWLLVAGAGPSRASASTLEKTLPVNPAELDGAALAATLDLAQSAGVTQVQAGATWWWLTRAGEGTYDWAAIDRLVDAAEARGMSVALQLAGTPDWVHPDLISAVPEQLERTWYPPVRTAEELAHWQDFVRDVVNRYGGRVAHFEIWNEENTPEFWKPAPDPSAYARLLRAAYQAAKETDPGATVVFGGLSRNDLGYLNAYYEGAERLWPGEASSHRYYFDVLGVHPYSAERSPRVNDAAYSHQGAFGEIDANFVGFRRLHQLVTSRESAKPVYLGEYGFSTEQTWMPAVPESVRAQHLRDAFDLAAAEDYVTGLSWYAYVPDSSNAGGWSIVDRQLNPSQTFEALRGVPSGTTPELISPTAPVEGEATAPVEGEATAPVEGEDAGDRSPRVAMRRVQPLKYVGTVRCGTDPCTAITRGRLVAVDKKRRRFQRETRATIQAEERARIKVKLPRRGVAAASDALGRGGIAKTKVKIELSDGAGRRAVDAMKNRLGAGA